MKAMTLEPEIVTRRGKPVSVILSVKAYEKLLERLEDAEDAAAMKSARKKPLSFRPVADYLADEAQSESKPWHVLRGSVVIHGDLTEPL